MGPKKYNPTAEAFSDFLKGFKIIVNQTFKDNSGQYIQTFLHDKLLISIQQELMNSNREDAIPQEMKVFLYRKQQYNQFMQVAMTHRATMMESDGKQKTPQRPQTAATPTKRFEGNCFYYDKLSDRQVECRQRARDPDKGALQTRERQQNTDDRQFSYN